MSAVLVGPERNTQLAPLRVPLAVKLFGANALIVAILLGARLRAGGSLNASVAAMFLGVLALHLALVLVALRPIRELETVASRVWEGDYGARVERSRVADERVLRVGSMFNILLDGLEADRKHLRALAAEVIAAGDRERAALARELHDSAAQRVAALLLQISSAARDTADAELSERLVAARDAAEGILEELRALSYTMHPSLLDDLGLDAALRKLARDASHGNGVMIDVDGDLRCRLPASVEGTFYRIAEEAVRNALRHGSPKHVDVELYRRQDSASIEIHDDGCGFDLASVDREQIGMGLWAMRERAALLDGWADIKTAKGSGTTVVATVPLSDTETTVHLEHS
ncbi:MAG TPA: sensor histidine kinase [Gemmatimonadaceae bacterium]|nr:sensor histidine kinase [Gemmatimonadaceae bacterium]